jgi:hypothetical protein
MKFESSLPYLYQSVDTMLNHLNAIRIITTCFFKISFILCAVLLLYCFHLSIGVIMKLGMRITLSKSCLLFYLACSNKVNEI